MFMCILGIRGKLKAVLMIKFYNTNIEMEGIPKMLT
jgi:hypothetical protein